MLFAPGTGIKTVQSLNAANTSWALIDYVNSYAENGNMNYIRLRNLYERSGNIEVSAVYNCVKRGTCNDGGGSSKIKKGQILITEQEYEAGLKMLDYACSVIYSKSLKVKLGRNRVMLGVLSFAYYEPAINEDRLRNVIIKNQFDIIPVSTVETYIRQLEPMYNKGIKNKVYVTELYKKRRDMEAWVSKKC